MTHTPTRTSCMEFLVVLVTALSAGAAGAQSLELFKEGGEVWSHEQVIQGSIKGLPDGPGRVVVNGIEYPFISEGGFFSVTVQLGDGHNSIVAVADVGNGSVVADTVGLILGYRLRPEVELVPVLEGKTLELAATVLDHPNGGPLSFEWHVDSSNPEALALSHVNDSTAAVIFPEGAPYGEYYFGVTVTDLDGDSFTARTFATVDSDGLRAFDVTRDYAAWIDEAIVYEITPYIFNGEGFSRNGRLEHIVNRIPELSELGINTIWIQPVFGTHGRGQGYDVTDYFNVRPDLGTEEDLREVIRTAREYGMRIMLDYVPNHSSIQHPYAQDAIEHGERSQYYDFYMREGDGAPYSQHYHSMEVGSMTFIRYFWDDLVTFNYANPEAQRFIVESSRYWIEEFDVDGYRFDAVWGPFARNPDFVIEWTRAMKRVKPDVFLLAEDKAPRPQGVGPEHPSIFEAFDAAYDWTNEMGYISRWAFQRGNESSTIFNTTAPAGRIVAIRNALTSQSGSVERWKDGFHPNVKILRYLENNDTPRFYGTGQAGCGGGADRQGRHNLEQTKMAATFMFSIPGVPLIYNGQEVGYQCHPYNTQYIFRGSQSMRSQHQTSLYPFYERLVEIRKGSRALQSDNIAELTRQASGPVFAYHRWDEDEHILGVMNMGEASSSVTLNLPSEVAGLDRDEIYYLTDLFSGEVLTLTGDLVQQATMDVAAYSTRLFALADHVVPISVEEIVDVPDSGAGGDVLSQNFPNPASDQTRVEITLPAPGRVRLVVVDMLGRTVHVALQGEVPAGRHEVKIGVHRLASGVYFLRLEHPGGVASRRMVVVR